MSDPVSLPFVLNEGQINAAIAAELPRLLKGLNIDYVSGRAPNGLRATVALNEEQIRQAVTGHARKLVNPSFTHFSIEFQPTRGEDGLTASIIASTAPITPEAADPAPTPAPVKPSPEKEPEAPVATAPEPETATTGEASAPEPEAEAAAEAVTADVVADPAQAEAQAETAEASTEAAEEPAAAATEAPAPAAGRSRLFADLQRPQN